jgi:hypothetical protein
MLMKFADALLWPGTFLCKRFGVDPKSDMGLMRSFFNFLIWLPLGLIVVLAFV